MAAWDLTLIVQICLIEAVQFMEMEMLSVHFLQIATVQNREEMATARTWQHERWLTLCQPFPPHFAPPSPPPHHAHSQRCSSLLTSPPRHALPSPSAPAFTEGIKQPLSGPDASLLKIDEQHGGPGKRQPGQEHCPPMLEILPTRKRCRSTMLYSFALSSLLAEGSSKQRAG